MVISLTLFFMSYTSTLLIPKEHRSSAWHLWASIDAFITKGKIKQLAL